MTQTTILICTLAALVGLGLGYWIGWAWDEVKPYVELAVSVVAVLWTSHRLQAQYEQLLPMLWMHCWWEEPTLDTEPAT